MFGLDDLISGALSFIGGERANKAQADRSREAMAFEERMSSTAYQRATADMRAAGINPMLAIQQGGASSPGGVMANMQDTISPAVSTAMQSRRLKEELKLIDQQRETLWAQGQKAWSDKYVSDSVVDRVRAETQERAASAKLLEAELPRAVNRAKVESTDIGKYGAVIDRVLDTLRSVFGLGSGSSARGRR